MPNFEIGVLPTSTMQNANECEGPPDVILIAMPWAKLDCPSIQLGTLLSIVQKTGVRCEVRSYYVAFMEHLLKATASLAPDHQISVDDYTEIANTTLIGDWIFAVPPLCPLAETETYFSYLRSKGINERLLSRICTIQEHVPDFLRGCAAEVLADKPKVVGFTTSFSQNLPSLVLSKMLKMATPSLKVVFGGANCDGPMGAELHRSFPWIDVVVRGEAEGVLPELVIDLTEDRPIRSQAGLCYREGELERVIDQSETNQVSMDDVPIPVYDEYFQRVEGSTLSGNLTKISIPFETARGCWWGAKQHCTFCGLNGSAMRFRSKSPDRAFKELCLLSAKYRRLTFSAVDNIIDMKYFNHFLPLLRDSGIDFELFYETKANLTKDQLQMMRNSGVTHIQPGIESLSSPILKLMRKGVTALQNIRLLKWCAELDIQVSWNVIYGFPREPIRDYERMAETVKSLTHLQPPDLVRLGVERFSPYHQEPESFGLTACRPLRQYKFIYRVPDVNLEQLAYCFEYAHADQRDAESYIGSLRNAVEEWKTGYTDSSLRYSCGPGFCVISDNRTTVQKCDYRLGETESKIYMACEDGARPKGIWESLTKEDQAAFTPRQLERFLLELLEAKLVYEEDDRFLSLAVRSGGKIFISRQKAQGASVSDTAAWVFV